MTPEDVLRIPPRFLSQGQRELYFDQGYLHLEGLITGDTLTRLREATAAMIEESRRLTASNDKFVLEPGHTADAPRLRRLTRAADHHPTFWDYCSRSVVPDLVADLVGPDVKFRECMVNFKWARGGEPIGWHQDLPFYPHTNLTPLITLTSLYDVTEDMGPPMVIPGSHRTEIFDHHDSSGRWAGRISDADLEKLPMDRAVSFCGPAGSVSVIHGLAVHGSKRNESARGRPIVVCGYSSADAFSYVPLGTVSRYTWQIVRGAPATHAHHDDVRMRIPPDWSRGYTSIFEDQKGERRASPYG